MTKPLTGRCLCGDISYSTDAAPQMTGVCHCKNCQRQAGSAFSILIFVPKSSISVSGKVKEFEDVADSGNSVFRQFCPRCGSPLFSQVPSQPDMTFIKAGTLDDTSILKPDIHFWCDSKQDWVEVDSALPQAAKNP